MPNRLAAATSPYLLQHKDNPVDWWEWADAAFAEARERDVPVLLSVGYAACHWCHVMAHESFEDQRVAALMNGEFVNVKDDREERPDVDAVYMGATQALTGQGGWPMTVFLTPQGRPFYAGTYFPPAPRHGMPSFPQVLQAIGDAWRTQREEMLYDNAQLARVYLHWWRLTGEPAGARIAVETCDWMVAALRTAQGGFASTLDADTTVRDADGCVHGVEGYTYVWTPAQLLDV